MLSRDLELSLNRAFKGAKARRHEFMTVEHLLLALLDNPSALTVFNACGVDLFTLNDQLVAYIEENTPLLPEGENEEKSEVQPTLGFQRVLQRAIFHVQSSGKEECAGANVLAAIFSEQESQACYLLELQDLRRVDVVNYISHGHIKQDGEEFDFDGQQQAGESDSSQGEQQQRPLDQFAVNLNEAARCNEIDPLIGRRDEIQRVAQILVRRRKNNPLLVGESGVGKTAIAEGLARLIVDKQVPDVLLNSTLYSLDLGALLAGTKYRGDFEKRLKGVLEDLSNEQDSILFIDEIHTIIGAGSTSGGAMDASNLLKPVLTSGKIRLIGSTTYQEFRGIFEKDRALSRRFQKVDVPEPSVEETFQILRGLKPQFEQHYGLKYQDKALRSAAELSARHITDRYLPDKAIDVVDEAGAYQRLQSESQRKKTISAPDIEAIISKIARIPARSVSSSDKEQLRGLEEQLNMVVFGQSVAISAVADAIKLSRAGLKKAEKPVGSFLFTGPTGVGKTEVCRQLAKIMGIELTRFDMSEYMERHTVSRLIGAPPGYVGFDQGGLLTDAVTKHPHSVILLDEIEKAHPEVFNLLLQVMDHGVLTDSNGRKADFRNVILIMTSNAGAESISRASMGFTKQNHASDGMEALKKVFTPEFRNRLDTVVQFGTLPIDVVKTVVDKFIVELQTQVDDKAVHIQLTEQARDWIAHQGYDENMGARPMARVIDEKIKKPLAEQLLFGDLVRGGKLIVDVKDDVLDLNVLPATKKVSKAKKQSKATSVSAD